MRRKKRQRRENRSKAEACLIKRHAFLVKIKRREKEDREDEKR
jgi:hypothetical protein